MFNPMKHKLFAKSVLTSAAAGIMLAGSAAMAESTHLATAQHGHSMERYEYLDNDSQYRPANAAMHSRALTGEVNPDNIRYITGGIGQDEQRLMREAEREYSTKVVFANSNGAFMSDVDVTVKDSSGNTVLGLRTDGPVLLMDLKPGEYTLSADNGEQVKTQKLSVSDTTRSYTLHFKTDAPLGYDRSAG